MSPTIIDKLSKKRNSVNKIIKITSIGLILGFFSTCTTLLYLDKQKELPSKLPYKIANELIIEETSEAENAAFNYLKKNPSLIDRFPNDNYKTLQRLKKIVLDRDKTENLEKRLTVEDPNVLFIDGVHYFSSFEIGKDSVFAPRINMVFDPKSSTLYRLNRERQILEREIPNVKELIILPDAAYFSQGNKVFKKSENSKIVEVCKSDDPDKTLRLLKIEGTDYGAILGKGVPIMIGNSNAENLDLQKKVHYMGIIEVLTEVLKDFEIDKYTRIVYSNDDWIYVSNEDNIKATDGKNSLEIEAEAFTDFSDYMILDLDKDNKHELVVYTKAGIDRIDVYKIEGFHKHPSKLYSIKDLPKGFKLPYGVKNPDLECLTPKKLKTKIKERLKQ